MWDLCELIQRAAQDRGACAGNTEDVSVSCIRLRGDPMKRRYTSETLGALSDGFFIEAGGRILPTLNRYRIGIVGAVVRTRDEAENLLTSEGEIICERYGGDVRVQQVDDAWALMRRAAGEGLCGFQLFAAGEWSHRYMFMVRVEEAGRELPTVLASIHGEDGWSTALTRTREVEFEHGEVLHWQRFDILDNVSGEAGQTGPFRNWKNGDPLFEIRATDVVVLLADVPLVGDWNSTEGAFAFFTSAEQAEHYLTQHLRNGQNRVLTGPLAPPSDFAVTTLAVQPVLDLKARLGELLDVNPFAIWCVNPDSHREDTAYGRLAVRQGHEIGFAVGESRETRMAAVSGIWVLEPSNCLRLLDPYAPWTGYDTIRWSGGQSLQLLPLGRSFGSNALPSEFLLDATESELEDLIDEYLGKRSLEDCLTEQTDSSDRAGPLEAFFVMSWDTVTGEGRDCPWRFTSVFEALRHLSVYEKEHDREHRETGAVSCGHVGFLGSNDPSFEDLRSCRFQLGIRRMFQRIVRRGFTPSDGEDIAALCNGVLVSLHVEYVGHAKDLLWASPEAQRVVVMEDLGIADEDWIAWESSANLQVDPEGRAAVVERIGSVAWDALEVKTQHFLATAVLQFASQRHAPQLDYAPVSLEVVKALEVELAAILENFKSKLGGAILSHNPIDREESNLAAYLAGTPGKKAPTLGSMAYFLRPPTDGSSALVAALYGHFRSLKNSQFLLDKKFFRDGLSRVTTKFRNGGVHDSSISERVCSECIDVLIGSTTNPGYIAKTAAWKSGSAL